MFQKKPTAKEQVRTSQRELNNGVRDLEREAMALKREEAVLVREIKHAAAKGNTPLVRQQAKSLVQVRQQQARLGAGGAHLRGLRSSLTTASASAKVAQTMGSATQAMAAMGQVVDPHKMQQHMAEFSRQSAQMDMAGDVMGDVIDDAFEDDTEEESSEVMNQVLDEIGIDFRAKVGAAPQHKAATAQKAAASTTEDKELQAALAALKS